MKRPLTHIGIVVNETKQDSFPLIGRHVSWLRRQGCQVALLSRSPIRCPGVPRLPLRKFLDFTQAVFAFGGDGTLLSVARLVGSREIPVVGINTGGLGFLTGINIDDFPSTAAGILAGDYRVEERMLLKVALQRRHSPVKHWSALNDMVISRGIISRLMSLSVSAGPELINTYIADGLIVATPTGSTAYSLSAGGPILHPEAEAIIINPICPHSLTERPFILTPEKKLVIRLNAPELKARLTLDGQVTHPLSCRDRVIVSRGPYPAKLIVSKDYSFYRMLRSKLHWGVRKGKTGRREEAIA